ncbi:MAG: ParB N-terminal domain-containing protein [Thaumarchaeota archaeon]|nr:ParB N-terminal domain-containing protein [Nitrososphaerota archaeon]
MLEKETPDALPIEQCEIHPMAVMRFSYEKDIDGLVESIGKHGQLEPGRAVAKPDGKGFLVYIGGRRLSACKKLSSQKSKLKVYKAYVDEGLTEKDIVSRAIAENATDKKQRTDVELLEELHYLSSLPFPPNEVRELALAGGMGKESLSKKMDLFEFLEAEEFESLHMIEEETGFQFKLGHLTGIWKYSGEDRAVFFGACSCAAENNWSVEGLNEDLVLGAAPTALTIPWFPKLFPELASKKKKAEPRNERGEGGTAPNKGSSKDNTKDKNDEGGKDDDQAAGESDQDEEHGDDPLDAILKNSANTGKYLYYIACKKCGAEIPFDYNLQTKGSPVATTYEFKDDGKSDGVRIALDSRYEGRIECTKCQAKLKIVLVPDRENVRTSIEESRDEEETPVGEVIEASVTTYSLAFKQFLVIDQGKWYFYDSQLGRRIPMTEDDVKMHKSSLRQG